MSLEEVQENPTETGEGPEVEMRVRRATPVTPYYSYLMVACLIAVFIAEMAIEPSISILVGAEKSGMLAGFDKAAFVYGEYWRILTGAVVHGGIVHLAFNAYALYVLGRLIETLSNRAHLGIIFLLSAIGGNLLSLFFMPEGGSVGASGGIIGFLGYLTVYGYRRRELLTSRFLQNMLFNIGFIALVGISLVYEGVPIDNFGHLGGLLTGALYGFLQIPSDLHKDPREVSEPMEIIGIAALGIFAFVSILTILLLLRMISL
ncbi:MAG: rhomboid family intramembrane serine protease [Pyrinomonadaceae bacterium]